MPPHFRVNGIAAFRQVRASLPRDERALLGRDTEQGRIELHKRSVDRAMLLVA